MCPPSAIKLISRKHQLDDPCTCSHLLPVATSVGSLQPAEGSASRGDLAPCLICHSFLPLSTGASAPAKGPGLCLPRCAQPAAGSLGSLCSPGTRLGGSHCLLNVSVLPHLCFSQPISQLENPGQGSPVWANHTALPLQGGGGVCHAHSWVLQPHPLGCRCHARPEASCTCLAWNVLFS